MLSKRWQEELKITNKINEIESYLESVKRTSDKFMRNNIYLLDLQELENILNYDDRQILEQADELKLLYSNQLNYETNLLIYGIIVDKKISKYILISDNNDEDEHYEGINSKNFIDNIDYKILTDEEAKFVFDQTNSFAKSMCNIIDSQYFEDWGIKTSDCKKCFKCEKLKQCCEKFDEEVENQATADEFWADYALCNPMDC